MKKKKIFKIILSAALAAALLSGCANNSELSGGSSETGSASGGSSAVTDNASSSANSSTGSTGTPSVPDSSQTVGGESSTESTNNSGADTSSDNTESSNSPDTSSGSESGTTSEPENSGSSVSADTPFGKHGVLSVNGTDLVDSSGKKYQLRGMSTHGIAWFPDYINADTFKYLRDDWNTNCIRLAMYTHESSGYCTDGNKDWIKGLVKSGVDYATELGMYVIIDWHVLGEQNPLRYKDEAVRFFDEMSKLYADRGNVIYEICNEPNSSASWRDITTYANEVIPVIRANDPDSVILVGTPTWSQDIDQALAAPLSYDNVMYSLHFYAATHTDWLRSRMENCIKSGLPVFVSEFGTCDASGNGAVDVGQSNQWKDLIERYNVSYMCWNLANKNESSSIINSGCSKLYGWSDSELSRQGKWIRDWFVSETD